MRTTPYRRMPRNSVLSDIMLFEPGCGHCDDVVRRTSSPGSASNGWRPIGCRLRAFFIRGLTSALPLHTRGGSPVRELRTPGSVRGVSSNGYLYRDNRPKAVGRDNFPILLLKASSDQVDCPVYGEKIDISTVSFQVYITKAGWAVSST